MLTLEPFSKDQGRSVVQPTGGSHQVSFLVPHGFTHPSTRTHVRLLGPCFKTGRMGSPQLKAMRTQVPRHVRIDVGFPPQSRRRHDHEHANNSRFDRRHDPLRSAPQANRQTVFEPFHMRLRHIVGPHSLPSQQFQALLTLFSKSFSSFPRGTCSLSVSRQYLALDGAYHPIWAAFPNNPTRRQRLVVRQGPSSHGALTLSSTLFQGTSARSATEDASSDYNSNGRTIRLPSWATPVSLAVTRGILVSFFSSAH